jgi:hypothetical protein
MVASSSHADMPEQNSVNLAIAAGHIFIFYSATELGWHLAFVFGFSEEEGVCLFGLLMCFDVDIIYLK